MLDFTPVRLKERTLDDLAAELTIADLHDLTDEMVDTFLTLIEEAADQDVTFEPQDPEAFDSFTDIEEEVHMPWTLGHVIVHITASAEEAAAQSATLARGVKYRGRSRYEVPWRSVRTAGELRRRLEESRRMRHGFLQAWPDEPHLENTFTPKYPDALPRNAFTYYLAGLMHDDAHLGQIQEIMDQARSAHSGKEKVPIKQTT